MKTKPSSLDIEELGLEITANSLANRLYVARTEQRVIDCNTYGANCYAPITFEDCLAEIKGNELLELNQLASGGGDE